MRRLTAWYTLLSWWLLAVVLLSPTTRPADAAWCTHLVDCGGSGGRVAGADWNDARTAAMKSGDACAGDLGGTFPNCTVTGVQVNTIALTTDTTGNYAAGDAEAGAATSVATDAVGELADIATGLKSGLDVTLVTGTAGTTGNCAEWDANGDLIDAGAACGVAGVTLDQAFDNGKIIDGATSEANAFQVGDATDKLLLWCASGACTIQGPAASPLLLKANITLHTLATVALTAPNCTNFDHYNNDADAIDFTLCSPTGGEVLCFSDDAAGVITIDTFDTGDTIVLNGTPLTAGNAIDSPGARGNFLCLEAKDTNTWITKGTSGVWVDGGAD